MKNSYSQDEIDALVQEVQEQFLSPLFKSANEELAKAEKGKQVPSAKEGGNGTVPGPGAAPGDGGNGPRADTLKAEAPVSAPADDEAPPAASPDAAPAASASPSEPAASPEAPAASPEAGPEGAAPEGAGGGAEELKQAYAQLDDQALQMHYEALKAVLMEKMGAAGGSPDAPAQPDMPGASPAPAASAPPAGPPPGASPEMAPPVAKRSSGPGGDGAPMLMGEESMSKAEKEITELKAKVDGLTDVLAKLLVKPNPKAVTTMTEFVQKSEPQVAAKKLSKGEVEGKLRNLDYSKLSKSDGNLVLKYYNNEVSVKDLEHLLK